MQKENFDRDFSSKIEGEFNFLLNVFFGPIHFIGNSYVNLTLSPKVKLKGKFLKDFFSKIEGVFNF